MQISSFAIQPVNQVTRTSGSPETPLNDLPMVEEKIAKSVDEKATFEERIGELENVFAENNLSLKFRQDRETGHLVVEIIDNETGEAIRQTPSEVSLQLRKVFGKVQGQFMDAQG